MIALYLAAFALVLVASIVAVWALSRREFVTMVVGAVSGFFLWQHLDGIHVYEEPWVIPSSFVAGAVFLAWIVARLIALQPKDLFFDLLLGSMSLILLLGCLLRSLEVIAFGYFGFATAAALGLLWAAVLAARGCGARAAHCAAYALAALMFGSSLAGAFVGM